MLGHGTLVDSSRQTKTIPLLKAGGYHVTAAQDPLTLLTNDVATTARAIPSTTGRYQGLRIKILHLFSSS